MGWNWIGPLNACPLRALLCGANKTSYFLICDVLWPQQELSKNAEFGKPMVFPQTLKDAQKAKSIFVF